MRRSLNKIPFKYFIRNPTKNFIFSKPKYFQLYSNTGRTFHSFPILSNEGNSEFEKFKPDTSDPGAVNPEDVIIDKSTLSEDEKIRQEGKILETETVDKNSKEVSSFQTETKKLLEIVATALYTDKEVFIRELISNASDALEKLRTLALSDSRELVEDDTIPLEIKISVDDKNKLFIIQDNGVGMTKEELIRNIGTIAHSGSKSFVQALQKEGKENASNIIGQFGVGFYSIFMVAESVRVYSRSAKKGSKGYCWESTGDSGEYTISEADGVSRGIKIVLQLKESEQEFCIKETVERIVKKYSNFVAYPILLNGSKISTIEAIWLKSPKNVSQEEHKLFFKYLTNLVSDPLYTIHFVTDIPLNIHALFYIPENHSERFGSSKMEPGVNVYCKKVLIQAKHKDILPDWLRFVKGCVDSEDLPLHISREHIQNSPLIRRINTILTRKILRFFQDMIQHDRKKYIQFFTTFGHFLKEGIASDVMYKDDISKCLVFETSLTKAGELVTLEEYVQRKNPEQKEIYFVSAAKREFCETSPYMEVFRKKNFEVLYLYSPVDEFVMSSIQRYRTLEIKSIDSSDIKPEKITSGLTNIQVTELESFWTKVLIGRLESVEPTNRLTNTPAVIKNPENASMRMMRAMQQGNMPELGPQKLLIDPEHILIRKLYHLMKKDLKSAEIIARQIFNNALISSNLLDDPRNLIENVSNLMAKMMENIEVPESKIEEPKTTTQEETKQEETKQEEINID